MPLQPVSSERNHQVADKFRKVGCLNVYGRKRGRVGVKQCMHSFHSLDCLLSVFFDDYMSKLFPIFYLANFVCFYPSKYKVFGSYDGAEICELVGLFILNKLGQKFGKENIGLYRDDGLAIMKSKSARLADKTRKELHKCLEQFGLKITAEANLHVVNFLDVTFDLNNGKLKPYRKPNDDPLYINRHSNHPPSIIKQVPASINKRVSALSADEQTFHESAPIYQNALRHSNFDHAQTRLHEASTTKNMQKQAAQSFGSTLHSAKTSKQTSHAIFYA